MSDMFTFTSQLAAFHERKIAIAELKKYSEN